MPKKSRKVTKTNRRKTMRCNTPGQSYIVRKFLEMVNVIKLYHWKTRAYSEHKATDDLYTKLSANVDRFVEVYLGKDGSRIKNWNSEMSILQYHRKKDFRSKMFEYREFLTDLSNCLDAKRDVDLLNIRDEILADLNQFLYLFSFNKA